MKRGFLAGRSLAPKGTAGPSAPPPLVRPPHYVTAPEPNEPTTLHWVTTPACALCITAASAAALRSNLAFSNSTPLPPLEALYAIEDVKGKGKGFVATKHILDREVIMQDRPLVVFDAERRPPRLFEAEFIYAVGQLSPASQQTIAELHNAYGGLDKLRGTLETNAYQCIELAGTGYSGLFPVFSRVNHSCNPNSVISWDEQTFSLKLTSTRRIEPGEEITTTYIVTCQKRRERRSQLMVQVRPSTLPSVLT